MPKISIVMPVYNTGEQLFKTLSSIMGQQEKDYEILIVDDCSDDELTKEIENTFERFDPRFKVIRQDKQMGAAMCRNHGLKIANGKYIVFLDSDDLFYDDFLLEMSQTLDENKADICVANFYMVDIVSNEKSLIISKKKKGITDKVFNVRELGKDALDYWMPVPWNKMFRKSFLVDKKIEFQNLRNCNDTYFGFSSVIKADGIIFCRKEYPLISYRVNNSKQISYEMDPRNMMKAYGRLFEENEYDAVIIEMLINELKISIEPMISRCSNQQFNNECREMAQKLTGKYQQKVATK